MLTCNRSLPIRRRGVAWLAAACLTATAVVSSFAAHAADAPGDGAYPNRSIKLVVPFAAGSQIDIAARLVGGKLADALAQPVVVENRPGASGNIGSEIVAKAPPDGYTLLLTGSLITLLPSTLGPVAVDPVQSFAPITKLAEPPIIIVAHPSLNVTTLAELVALAKQRPGKISYATAGIGTVQHLIATVFARKAGIDIVHVPYANSGQALKDVIAGEVPLYFAFLGPLDAQLKSGQLRALAVASNRRMRAWPDIPTVVELGYPSLELQNWFGFFGPAGLSPEVAAAWERELRATLDSSDVTEQLSQLGLDVETSTGKECAQRLAADMVHWQSLLDTFGLKETN